MRLHKLLGKRPISILALSLACESCAGDGNSAANRMAPVYDQKTGKLQLLKYDSNADGKVDTWSHMDGARVVRIDIDKDQDGLIDRWEYYGPDRKLEKVGFSRAKDGKEDAWSYAAPDGSLVRIDVSTRRDGHVSRVEHFEKDLLIAAEEDSDGDGTFDKWETYDGERLASVAFDTAHRGTPDRRLVYGKTGAARLEIDAKGTGQFVAIDGNAAAGRPAPR
jgi:hypothetical protein